MSPWGICIAADLIVPVRGFASDEVVEKLAASERAPLGQSQKGRRAKFSKGIVVLPSSMCRRQIGHGSFPILRKRTISWDPVAGTKPPKIDGLLGRRKHVPQREAIAGNDRCWSVAYCGHDPR